VPTFGDEFDYVLIASACRHVNTSVTISMGRRRTSGDLDIYVGKTRRFEWFWDVRGEMLGLDAFDELDDAGRAAIIAALEVWGDLELGKHVSTKRVNEEHSKPKILAIKIGNHRFATFHAGENTWIVCHHYKKQKNKLDKLGKAAIRRTIAAQNEYVERVRLGEYYERG
jgi:hypothetical protein